LRDDLDPADGHAPRHAHRPPVGRRRGPLVDPERGRPPPPAALGGLPDRGGGAAAALPALRRPPAHAADPRAAAAAGARLLGLDPADGRGVHLVAVRPGPLTLRARRRGPSPGPPRTGAPPGPGCRPRG